ncbi:MAG: CubicO group peptidase (beta-lactamase class C family) [Patiriisocius sp.]
MIVKHNRNRAPFIIVCGFISVLFSQASLATDAWPISTPADEGVDAAALSALDAELLAGKHGNVDSLLIIRHGKVVFESLYPHDYATQNPVPEAPTGMYNYYDPRWHPWYFGNTELHTMQSVTKSVLSVLYGVASQRGVLPPADSPALALLTGRKFADPDGRKAKITLSDLLTMRSGLAWDEENYPYTDLRNDAAVMEASSDWVQFVLDKPMAMDAGSSYLYNSGVTMVLGEILEQLTGQKLAAYAEKELFEPLGITESFWKHSPKGLADVEGGLYLSPRDMAKIVRLYQQGGRWNGRQIVPEQWVHNSLVPATVSTYPGEDIYEQWGYGYQWWVFTDYLGQTAWGGSGYGGQYPVVVPGLDLIVVFTGWNIYEGSTTDPLSLLRDRILPAVH